MKKGIVKAVNDVSFSIDQGEILAIVGESGSGKSVASLSIMGLDRGTGQGHRRSEILFKGKDLVKMPLQELQKIRGDQISMIFQEPMTSLNPVVRIKDQLIESIRDPYEDFQQEGRLGKRAQWKCWIWWAFPRLKSGSQDYPHQMSGGMRQTGDDRHGALLPSGASDRRRTDDGAWT